VTEHKVTDIQNGIRLDKILSEFDEFSSRSKASKYISDGKVFLDGRKVAKNATVKTGQIISFETPSAASAAPQSQDFLKPTPISLDIRYEDNDIIVLSKQIGLVCHPGEGYVNNTLVNALIYHCGIENLASSQGADRPGIIHRLDRDTSGFMLAAKSERAAQKLQQDIRERLVERHYLTLVHGIIAPDTGLIDVPIARDPKERTKMKAIDTANSRQSITTFEVLQRFSEDDCGCDYTLLDCKLHTGRTHQIRVHFEYIAHPVVGEQAYGVRTFEQNLGLNRQFLHSYKLSFTHPVTLENMHFEELVPDGLPQDLQDVLSQLPPIEIKQNGSDE
jgi:23S rRNA pseudouridine1911/1915/1917 synthase